MKNSILLLLLASTILAADKKENSSTSEEKKVSSIEIADHAKFWCKELPDLTSEELQLLANLLYFDFLSNYYESSARRLLIAIHNYSILMNKQLVQSEEEAGKIALENAKQLRQLKEEVLPIRTYALLCCHGCIQAIEKSEFTTLKEIIINLQQYSKAVITQFIKQDKNTIEKIVETGYKALEAHVEKLSNYKTTLKNILDNENPYLKDGIDPDMANFEVSLALSDAVLASLNEITIPATVIKMMSCDVLSITSLISKAFYTALYDSTSESQKEELMVMFDRKGLIPVSKRDEPLMPLNEKFMINKKHYTT